MDTLGDVLEGVKKADDILSPILYQADNIPKSIFYYSNVSDIQPQVGNEQQLIFLDEKYGRDIEHYAFDDKPIESLALIQENGGPVNRSKLEVRFKGGLAIAAETNPYPHVQLRRNFNIHPLSQPNIFFSYIIMPHDIHSTGFELSVNQIPDDILNKVYVEKLIESCDPRTVNEENFENELACNTVKSITDSLTQRAVSLLRQEHQDLQSKKLGIDMGNYTYEDGYFVIMTHYPGAKYCADFDFSTVFGSIIFNPILFDSDPMDEELAAMKLSDIDNGSIDIEVTMREAYDKLSIEDLEDLESAINA
ncbi:MAG: hypothetical protein GY861_06425 [bacterium]|nr:hypothetical protein [bacterium]